jgi:hypothetical protein
VFDGHGWLVASVEAAGGRWQTDVVSPVGCFLRKVFERKTLDLDFPCKVFILLGGPRKLLI